MKRWILLNHSSKLWLGSCQINVYLYQTTAIRSLTRGLSSLQDYPLLKVSCAIAIWNSVLFVISQYFCNHMTKQSSVRYFWSQYFCNHMTKQVHCLSWNKCSLLASSTKLPLDRFWYIHCPLRQNGGIFLNLQFFQSLLVLRKKIWTWTCLTIKYSRTGCQNLKSQLYRNSVIMNLALHLR